MKISIPSPVLRERFSVVWSCVPDSVREELRPFILEVRQVDTIEVASDGDSSSESDAPILSHTYCVLSGDDLLADIVLSAELLTQVDPPGCLAIILHELAHAYDILTNHEEIRSRSTLDTELIALEQARQWTWSSGLSDKMKFEVGALLAYYKFALFG
jgi:hypothetical protein